VHDRPVESGILLVLGGADPRVGDSGYQLDVGGQAVTARANTPSGLFAAVQTLRQLLPVAVESGGRWTVPGVRILDYPRFAHRGAMLDVSRHFFTIADVKRYIDQIAQYKINVLHLHLTDDQGWRIEIRSWPRLATVGGRTQVGGGPGGSYTQDQYRELVAYAAARYITIVPEIDVPGHTNAALASYPELNRDGVAPPAFTGTGSAVGFSSLRTDLEITYRLMDDVLAELAALTPGEYLHLGTDEAHATTGPEYRRFLQRVLPMVAKHGKKVIGWHEILAADLPESAVPQYWGTTSVHEQVAEAAARGHRIVLSPANRAYLDMKYDRDTPVGFEWAGFIDVDTAYGWDPGSYLQGVPESAILGVEAPLWSETLAGPEHIDLMAFPRLPAIAELGWSPRSSHDWDDFRRRLAAHGPRWAAQGINFYRSSRIAWP
jgi:hexosaminidase